MMDMPFAPRRKIDQLDSRHANRQILTNLLRRLKSGQPALARLVEHSRRIAGAINRLAHLFSPELQQETERLMSGIEASPVNEGEFEIRLNQLFHPELTAGILTAIRRIRHDAEAALGFLRDHATNIQADHAALAMAMTFCGNDRDAEGEAALNEDFAPNGEDCNHPDRLWHTLGLSLKRMRPLACASVALPSYLKDFINSAAHIERAFAQEGGMSVERALILLLNVQQIIVRAESLFVANSNGFKGTRLPVMSVRMPTVSAILADPAVIDRLIEADMPKRAAYH